MLVHIHIRPFEPNDQEYAAIGRIGYANFPGVHHFSAESSREWDWQFQFAPHCKHQRFVAVHPETKQLVGYASYSHEATAFHPQKFQIELLVDPAWQRHGIGTQLWNHLKNELRKQNAILARGETRQDKSASLAFLHKLDFKETLQHWESHLDAEKFNFAPFYADTEKIKTLGIDITTLAKEGKSSREVRRKLYELHITVRRDVPQAEPYTAQDYELFEQRLIESPRVLDNGYFIAKKNGEYIGESTLFKVLDNPQRLSQGLTAVRREFRGQGIAMALKLETIRYAQQQGYKIITTRNESNNIGMLAINQKLGFVREPTWILFEKSL